jgi:hypothetical protein
MGDEQFVDAVKLVVYDATVRGVRKLLEDPSGRAPRPNLVNLSHWYRGLSDTDREMVVSVARLSADHSVFGFLAVLDGARAWESAPRGDLRLLAGNGEDLNPNHNLHNLFRGAVDQDHDPTGHA